jgi:arginase
MGEPMPGLVVPGPHEELTAELPAASQQERMGLLYRELAEWTARTESPTVFAGDCVSTIGVLAGLERKGVTASLVFFDAHGDFNTWETSPGGFIGGMPLAMLTGRGEQTIVERAGLQTLPDERVVLVDGRDLDPGEDEALEASGVRIESVLDIPYELPDGPIYLHIDGDVVDPSDMPAMNYPAPNGPSLGLVTEAVELIAETGRVVAFSLSSWNPQLPEAGIAAMACHEIALPFLD